MARSGSNINRSANCRAIARSFRLGTNLTRIRTGMELLGRIPASHNDRSTYFSDLDDRE